jgi:hypothetical protein
MAEVALSVFQFFFPPCSRPSYRGRGNRGKGALFPFRDVSGIAGNL